MPNRQRHKPADEKAAQRARTARNKARAIERALLTAGEPEAATLRERLVFWAGGGERI